MTDTTILRARFSSIHEARRAIDALVDNHYNLRNVEVRARIGGDWRRLELRSRPRDEIGAIAGFVIGLFASSFLVGLQLGGAVQMNFLPPPMLSLMMGAFLGGITGALWGLLRSRVDIEYPLRSPDEVEVHVRSPRPEEKGAPVLREAGASWIHAS